MPRARRRPAGPRRQGGGGIAEALGDHADDDGDGHGEAAARPRCQALHHPARNNPRRYDRSVARAWSCPTRRATTAFERPSW